MVFRWFSYGFPMVCSNCVFSSVFLLVFLWFSGGFLMVFLWWAQTGAFPIVFFLFSYMLFLCFPYAFPMLFLCFPCAFPMFFPALCALRPCSPRAVQSHPSTKKEPPRARVVRTPRARTVRLGLRENRQRAAACARTARTVRPAPLRPRAAQSRPRTAQEPHRAARMIPKWLKSVPR